MNGTDMTSIETYKGLPNTMRDQITNITGKTDIIKEQWDASTGTEPPKISVEVKATLQAAANDMINSCNDSVSALRAIGREVDQWLNFSKGSVSMNQPTRQEGRSDLFSRLERLLHHWPS
jgi:hypothetical protein